MVGFNSYMWFRLSGTSDIPSSSFLRKPSVEIWFLHAVFIRNLLYKSISTCGFLKKPSIKILSRFFLSFLNDLVWKNHQHKSCRSLKVMKFCSWYFYLKSFQLSKIASKFVKFKMQILQMTSMEKVPK
jgi:hypothetical protein